MKTWRACFFKVCREQNESNPINHNGDGNHRPYTCTECCQSDLCNAEGCGQKGWYYSGFGLGLLCQVVL